MGHRLPPTMAVSQGVVYIIGWLYSPAQPSLHLIICCISHAMPPGVNDDATQSIVCGRDELVAAGATLRQSLPMENEYRDASFISMVQQIVIRVHISR